MTDLPRSQCETTISGNGDRLDAGTVETGLLVEADGSTVIATLDTEPAPVVVTGESNRVVLQESDQTIDLYLEGDSNAVVVDESADCNRHGSGESNAIRRDDLGSPEEDISAEELVSTSRQDALTGSGLFGRAHLSYQEPAPEEDHCDGCGAKNVAVIKEYSESALVLFGYPIRLKRFGGAQTCEECYLGDVELTEEEREEIF